MSSPRTVIYSQFFAKKCCLLTFLRPKTSAASGVGVHISSSRNCETDDGYYTIIVPMPRISACIPWHRHGYLPPVDIRAYATGYRQISVALGTILISVASGLEDIGRYPWHMPRDRCAQPFPFPHCILEPCTTQQLRTPTILESFVDRRPSWSTTQCALYRCESVMPICMKGTLFPTLSHKYASIMRSWCQLLGTNHFGHTCLTCPRSMLWRKPKIGT